MNVKSDTLTQTPEDGFFKKLLERRVPQILLFYIGTIWTLFGIVSWCVNRYVLSPHLEELFLMTGLLFLPAVLIIAYGHGAKGKEPWKRYEKVGLLCNALIAVSVLVFMFKGKDLGSAQRVVQVVDVEGNEVERVVPKDAFRKRVALFHFDNKSGDDDLDWVQAAIPTAWDADLDQDLFLTVQHPAMFVDKFQKAGFQEGLNIPTPLKRSITTEYNLAYFVNGSFTKEGDDFVVSATLYEAERGKEVASHEYRGNDLFVVVDQMTENLKKDLDLPSKHIEDTVDLPVTDVLTASETALKAYSEGMFSLGFNRDFPTALANFSAATSEDPTFALAFIQKYILELQQGQMQPAVQSLGMAQQHNYRLTEQMKYLIKVAQLNLSGNPDQALEATKQWTTLFPNDMLAHQIAGLLYSLRKDYDEAIASYRKILEVDPYEDKVALEIGTLLQQAGRTDEAIAQYEDYIETYPEKNDGYQMLAEVYQDQGNQAKELETRELALSISPNDPGALRNLGDVLKRMGNFDEALRRYEAAVAQSQTPQEQITSYRSLGSFHQLRGEHEKAAAAFDEVINVANTSLPVLLQIYFKVTLVPDYYQAGLRDKAREMAQEGITNPAFDQFGDIATMAAGAASYIDARENDGQEGLQLLDRAEAIVDANSMNIMKSNLLYARGDVYKEQGDYVKARELYEAFVALEPTATGGLNKLGQTLYAMEEYNEAEEYFLEALNYFPSSPTAHMGLARIAVAQGDQEKARTHLDKALLAWANADATSKKANEAKELLATL